MGAETSDGVDVARLRQLQLAAAREYDALPLNTPELVVKLVWSDTPKFRTLTYEEQRWLWVRLGGTLEDWALYLDKSLLSKGGPYPPCGWGFYELDSVRELLDARPKERE
jgi:hypothetical protein